MSVLLFQIYNKPFGTLGVMSPYKIHLTGANDWRFSFDAPADAWKTSTRVKLPADAPDKAFLAVGAMQVGTVSLAGESPTVGIEIKPNMQTIYIQQGHPRFY